MKKYFITPFIFLLLLVLLSSCAQSTAFHDDLSCKELAEKLSAEADTPYGYSEYTREDIALLLNNTSLFDDSCFIYSTEVEDINEIAVFHCESKDNAKQLTKIILNYIFRQQEEQRAFIESYAPREALKLDGARVYQYGNYVVYLMLDDDDKEDAIEEIEEILRK